MLMSGRSGPALAGPGQPTSQTLFTVYSAGLDWSCPARAGPDWPLVTTMNLGAFRGTGRPSPAHSGPPISKICGGAFITWSCP